MDIIGISGIIVGILIAIIPYLWRKFILRPELTIDIVKDGGTSAPLGISSTGPVDKDGYVDPDKIKRLFALQWRFKIRITNNSDLTAFYPELEFNPRGPRFNVKNKLNNLQPIKPAETVELEAEYRKYEEASKQERTSVGNDMPSEFNDLRLLLSYQSSKKSKFYTLYNYTGNENKNIFLARKPKEYKDN